MSKISDFLEEYGFLKNEHGVYLYQSKDGKHIINIGAILQDFEEYEEKKYVYAVVYNEDQFEGIMIPGGHAELLRSLGDRYIVEFTPYKEEFHLIEVEASHWARHGSRGVKTLNSIEEFKKWFIERFSDLSPETIKILNDYEG